MPLVDVCPASVFAQNAHVLGAALGLVIVQFYAVQVFAERVEGVKEEEMRHAFCHRELHSVVGSRLIRLHQQHRSESRVRTTLLYVTGGWRWSGGNQGIIHLLCKCKIMGQPAYITHG